MPLAPKSVTKVCQFDFLSSPCLCPLWDIGQAYIMSHLDTMYLVPQACPCNPACKHVQGGCSKHRPDWVTSVLKIIKHCSVGVYTSVIFPGTLWGTPTIFPHSPVKGRCSNQTQLSQVPDGTILHIWDSRTCSLHLERGLQVGPALPRTSFSVISEPQLKTSTDRLLQTLYLSRDTWAHKVGRPQRLTTFSHLGVN